MENHSPEKKDITRRQAAMEAMLDVKGDASESSDLKKIDAWQRMAEILSETHTALELEKTEELDRKRIEWWKKEANSTSKG